MRETASKLRTRVETLARELQAARAEQAATAELLRVIAFSSTEVQPVLDSIVASAARLCDAYDATLYVRRGDKLSLDAHSGPIPIRGEGLPVVRDVVTGRAVLERASVHVPDLQAAGDDFATGSEIARQLGFHTILVTPLLREGEAIGALMLRRTEIRPFTDRQVELLKIFADQAVIAVENVRLFEEVHARNHALTKSLEQQTATNDILSVVASSPTDLQPVFDMIAERAARLCGARLTNVYRFDGELIHFVAQHGFSDADYRMLNSAYPMPPGRTGATSRAIMNRKVEQIADVLEDPDYALTNLTNTVDVRAVTAVPMLKNNRAIGAISVAASVPGLFPAHQIALLQTFADQAVIAIENVRLFEEVQARTRDLGEALQQQTATADVLKVISRSAFDLQTVLDTLTELAAQLCGADMAGITGGKRRATTTPPITTFPQIGKNTSRENA